ncbi:Flp pilus assembly protein CpaB [Novosphingobium sp. 1949]|uniref:Flp pilus assembly protein CpaB n=1 Tax=Novosphingobium organovorum TaxID=2930092 RepID=A0ABT0BB98_9SPHN|nr:Flp pilus assembly protein CpaB [Novosphingobium organovorum]MCJ2182330.1 Flp pilus assembly protein CpaB [Novosphingobium organovorum]
MDRKKLLLLVVALIVAAGTAIAARSMFAGASAPKAEAVAVAPKGPKVLVAQRALPVGTILTADSISYQDWPKELVKDVYFIDGEADMSKLLGTVVRYPITAGQPVTQGSLVAPGDRGFLAAALGPGMRAVTISVSAKTGVGGFIFPGDRVDMMLTQQVKGQGEPLSTTETILRNLRVLATDQTTNNDVEDGKTVVRAFRTVTLEVTPRIAEKIAVAEEIGELSLSLRSIADNQGTFESALASGDVKVPEGATKEQEALLMRQAMTRPIEGNSTYVTGGDVSRFQRSSAPPQAVESNGGALMPSPQLASAGAPAARPVPSGPVVRVTRGKVTTEEPVSTGLK